MASDASNIPGATTPSTASTAPASAATPITAPCCATSELTVKGLREQILANAVTLYPHLLPTSISYVRTGTIHPNEVFEVIISSPDSVSYTAILVSGSPMVRQQAARGAASACVMDALESLLAVTCETIGWYTENLLGEMENVEPTASGEVDFGMLQAGYDYAATARAWHKGHAARH